MVRPGLRPGRPGRCPRSDRRSQTGNPLPELFNPGPAESLFNAIMDRADPGSPKFDPDLYVHGVLNQDPEAKSTDKALVGLIHRGELDEADPDIVLPSSVDKRFASWDKEPGALDIVKVHSKVVVLDPFGPKPVVMTGSHNLGPRASRRERRQPQPDRRPSRGSPPPTRPTSSPSTTPIAGATSARRRPKKRAKSGKGPKTARPGRTSYYERRRRKAKQRELAFWLGE